MQQIYIITEAYDNEVVKVCNMEYEVMDFLAQNSDTMYYVITALGNVQLCQTTFRSPDLRQR